ncbi:hypothetical protein GCM10027432_18120 [Lysobacter fragariae]
MRVPVHLGLHLLAMDTLALQGGAITAALRMDAGLFDVALRALARS